MKNNPPKKTMGRPIAPPDDTENIIARIRRLTGWSQKRLADELGIKCNSTIARYERGEINIGGPALKNAERILAELK